MIKNRILYNNFCDWTFDVSHSSGSYLWDKEGKKLIDFTSGWNVANLGWNPPEVIEAVIKQAKKNTYAPMWTADPIQNEYARNLTGALPKELCVVARATGGTEANEESLKTARALTGRKKFVGFKDTYHGQSFATLAIGYLPEYEITKSIEPLVPGFIQLDFPKVYKNHEDEKEILNQFSEKLEKILSKKDVAAIITEAGIITGWGSTYVAPQGYLSSVKKLAEKYGTLLILDEVGTGFSRCGTLFGMEREKVVPDIATFAKGLSNGVAAMGAMVTTKEIAEETFDKSNLTSTFGWIPIACAAANKVLEIHKRDKVWLKAQRDGGHLLKILKNELGNETKIEDIRGMGMEVGVHFLKGSDIPLVDKIVIKSREKGLHLVSDHEGNIQLMPPLTIAREVLDKGLEIFIDVVKSLS